MDDTASPHDQVADGPDASGVPDADGSTYDTVGTPVTQPDADAPRFDLVADPFAPAAPVSEQPAEPVVSPEEAAVPDEAPADGEFEEAAEHYEAPADVVETDAAADASLDDLVSELETDDVPADRDAGTDDDDSASDAESVEGDESKQAAGTAESEGGEAAEPDAVATSWRDEAATEDVVPPLVRQRLSMRVPFWIYGGVWVVFVGAMTYLMWPLSSDPFVGTQYYSYFVLGCAALLALGPFLGLAAWLWGRMGSTSVERAGLVRAILLRTATWMAAGVALMWVCLYVLDLHRTGVIG